MGQGGGWRGGAYEAARIGGGVGAMRAWRQGGRSRRDACRAPRARLPRVLTACRVWRVCGGQYGETARDKAQKRGEHEIVRYLDGVTESAAARRAKWEAARQAPQEAENKAAAAVTAGDAMSDAALAAVQPTGRSSLSLGAIRVPPSARPYLNANECSKTKFDGF